MKLTTLKALDLAVAVAMREMDTEDVSVYFDEGQIYIDQKFNFADLVEGPQRMHDAGWILDGGFWTLLQENN